jgi:hypothetical protein
MCGYSFVAAPLRYGDVVTLVSGLVAASGMMLLLGLVLERRWLRPKDMALAFTFGDPALALGIASGVLLIGTHQPCGAIGPTSQLAVAVAWLIFGLWQWKAEVSARVYTRKQALSPTKIWHQVVIYPTIGTWSFVAIIGGLMNAGRNPLAAVVMTACLAIWASTLVYDIRHPRLGHPPYDWAHLRPVRPPWGEDSSTLRSAAAKDRIPHSDTPRTRGSRMRASSHDP